MHKRLYTYSMEDVPVQLVNLRVTAVGHLPSPESAESQGSQHAPQAASSRPVTFRRGDAARETPVYRREQLRPGARFDGPAIVEQNDTTTVVWPGFTAAVEPHGNIVIQAGGSNS
jgi:N-methylhydantoinase A